MSSSPKPPELKKPDCVAAAWGTFCHYLSYLAISCLPIFHVVETGKVREADTTVAKREKGLISPNSVDGSGLAPSLSSPTFWDSTIHKLSHKISFVQIIIQADRRGQDITSRLIREI